MKYKMDNKTDRPSFEYMVTTNDFPIKYWLYDDFNSAFNMMKQLSLHTKDEIGKLYEIVLDNNSREYYVKNTFTAFDGITYYEPHARRELHLHYYINAGEWMNKEEDI